MYHVIWITKAYRSKSEARNPGKASVKINSKQARMVRIGSIQTKMFLILKIRILDLLRLPARSRFGEGRDFQSDNKTLFNSSVKAGTIWNRSPTIP